MTVAALEAEAPKGTMVTLEADGQGSAALPRAFFGTAGLILAAPLTAAAIHISGDLAKVRAARKPVTTPAPAPPPA